MTTLIIGLDGGCFELIDDWLADGTLPNLALLCEQGASMDMQSCLPPVTCPNWQCYATGKNPGKLGVFWWERINREEERIENTSASSQFDGAHYWTAFDNRVATVNLPTNYPPEALNGVQIAGGPGSEQTDYTYPEGLEENLESKYGYQVHPEKMSLISKDNPENECVEEIYDLIDVRFDVVEDMLQSGDYELIHLTVFYLNVLQHFFWDYDVVKAAWERIDTRIGELLESEELEHSFVMSDHGSNEIETTFRINTWLAENGYLVTESGVSNWFHKLGLTRNRVQPILAKLGIEWWARSIVPRRIQTMLPSQDGTVDKSGKQEVINWEASTAVASGQGPVYVLESDHEKRTQIRDQLINQLDGLTNSRGSRVVEQAIPAEEIYEGEYVEKGPDILLDQAPGVHIEGVIGAEEVFGKPRKWRGENKDTGMFIAHGPAIEDGASVPDMHITDIAPTLLHLHGYPVPSDMDGQVRMELFGLETEPKEREIRYTDTLDQSKPERATPVNDDVSNRLETLGYLE